MILNNNNQDFPPKGWQELYRIFNELAAWYSGDPNQLLKFYSQQFQPTDMGHYWSEIENEERREAVHLPIAGDIASMSANLLFSETPELQFDEKTEQGKRIKGFIDENGLINTLLEGAELSAALSGLYLKLDYDKDLSEYPLLTIRTPSQAFPEFRSGRMVAITYHRVVKQAQDGSLWRLFERREVKNRQLAIQYKLYKGRKDKIGREVGLESIDETKDLGLEDEVLNIPVLGCVYIPNKLPNRLIPGSPIGESDYRDCIGLMDSLDFAWSSWMRDLELGLGQIFVDEGLLDSSGRFSKMQRVFVKLNMENIRLSEDKYEPIKPNQFQIRVDEHMKTCDQLARQIVSQAGYAPQSFGMVEYGRQTDSGTALRIRERKSLLTRQKKERYWMPELLKLFDQMQMFDAVKRGRQTSPEKVNIVPQDTVIQDETEKSETVRNLEQAKAASTYTKVKMMHPDWSEEVVEKEVQRINREQSIGDVADNPFENLNSGGEE